MLMLVTWHSINDKVDEVQSLFVFQYEEIYTSCQKDYVMQTFYVNFIL